MKLYHNLNLLPVVFALFCSCATTFKTKFSVEECVHICSSLVPYGFRPMWSREGVCACLAPPIRRDTVAGGKQ